MNIIVPSVLKKKKKNVIIQIFLEFFGTNIENVNFF